MRPITTTILFLIVSQGSSFLDICELECFEKSVYIKLYYTLNKYRNNILVSTFLQGRFSHGKHLFTGGKMRIERKGKWAKALNVWKPKEYL